MSDDKPIMLKELCGTHQRLLVQQAKYAETDPWQALLITANLVLFQVATCKDLTALKIGDDIHRIGELGCLACYSPDAFGEIVTAAMSHDLAKIKAVGDKWVAKNAKKNEA